MNNFQDILTELGIDNLPLEIQDRVLSKFTENLIKQIGLKVLTMLPESDRNNFKSLSEEGDAEKINNFLKEKIPNYEKIMAEEVNKAKEEFKKTLKELS